MENSILSNVVSAFVEWFLILMLLLNSFFSYLIFRFAHSFRLKKPCLCCSSSAVNMSYTHLICHHHATLIAADRFNQSLINATIGRNARYAAADDSSSSSLEFDFTEDEYDQKDILHDDGHRVVGGDGFSWSCAFSESQPLITDASTCCLRHGHESASAIAMRESMLQCQDTLIKHTKVNEDESYSIAYTAEGDLVMHLSRNLTSTKSICTASHIVGAIPHNKATTEQQGDELYHQVYGETLALQNIENAGRRRIELDENQPPEKSNDILTQSCLQYRTIEHVHEHIDEVPCSVCSSPPRRTEELVWEKVQGTSVPASVDISSDHANEPNPLSSFNGADNRYSNWLLFDKRESATEEAFDGSINSDFECGEGISTVDKLKTALRVERKALNALYAELEEERNASAVAASQTMAMINRLQEEKASVQMEALQYQRMMEEQSEYDQEALQLLNELMVKRETEKQELEKELEIYRNRVLVYETRERMMVSNRKEESLGSGSSSVSCSNADDCDGVSVDMKDDMKNMNEFLVKEENGITSTLFGNFLPMEESLSHLEEERLSILDQFKLLEDKIFTLDCENDGFSCSHDYSCIMNGTDNGCHDDVKGNNHHERGNIGSNAKMLLSQFDATIEGTENTELSRNENVHAFACYPNSSATIYEPENIEEEIDQVYERLQSLEADNEFLRHCFRSLNRGDKGLELLQEILQHLRNLRTVELELRK